MSGDAIFEVCCTQSASPCTPEYAGGLLTFSLAADLCFSVCWPLLLRTLTFASPYVDLCFSVRYSSINEEREWISSRSHSRVFLPEIPSFGAAYSQKSLSGDREVEGFNAQWRVQKRRKSHYPIVFVGWSLWELVGGAGCKSTGMSPTLVHGVDGDWPAVIKWEMFLALKCI